VYDSNYTNSTGPDLWTGLALAEERVRKAATEHGMAVPEYRKVLQQRFREAQSASQHKSASEEYQHESN